MLVAVGIDAVFGWPDGLYRRIGHPVTWIGALISWLDRLLNQDDAKDGPRRLFGIATTLIVVGATLALAFLLQNTLPDTWVGTVALGVLAWPWIAARSLHSHVAAVADPLTSGDLGTARQAVSMIVGRDPTKLDEPAVARAALESLAENASDGVVAPVFWGAIGGLPGIAAYKAINTLDSMIGHRTPRHEAFGWAAARLDDLVNLIPARLTALFFAMVSGRPGASLWLALRDARHHRSPNAGWPEAAMAGGLGVRLSGPRVYEGHQTSDPWVNDGAPDPTSLELKRGLALFRRSMVPLAGLLMLAALFGG